MMHILDLLGMYFDAAVVFVTNFLFSFRLAMAILWESDLFLAIFPVWLVSAMALQKFFP